MAASPLSGKLPDDVYRSQLRQALKRIDAWAATASAVATIEVSEAETYWRLQAQPWAQHACPFELIVHHDQHFDLQVGAESYERCPVGDVGMLAQLVEAIGEGRVITRAHVSRNTGAVRSIETIIELNEGRLWRSERTNDPLAKVIRPEDCETQDRRYVPYRLRSGQSAA